MEALTEPFTALVTLPFAYVGELSWNLAWLAYIPVAALLRRRSSASVAKEEGGGGDALSSGRGSG